MSQFSDEMGQLAKDLITEFGEAGSFIHTNNGVYNASTGEISTTTTPYTGMIVPTNYSNRDIDGTIIQRGDIKVYCHTMSAVPQVGDSLTFDSISYIIMAVKKTRANGNNVLYTLQVRQ